MDDPRAELNRRFMPMFAPYWPLFHNPPLRELRFVFDDLERVLWFNIVQNLEEDELFVYPATVSAAIKR